jgi:hypothetical protein
VQCRLREDDEVAASGSGRFLATNGAVPRRLPSSPPSPFFLFSTPSLPSSAARAVWPRSGGVVWWKGTRVPTVRLL